MKILMTKRNLLRSVALALGMVAMLANPPGMAKRVSTNVPGPQPSAHAPINQFGSMLEYPPASDHTIVRMNADTLHSFAWLDLSKEPVVLSVPDTHGRFYLMTMIDAWTNVFASPGKRLSGSNHHQGE